MKNTINATIIRNRYNALADNATHEKAVLLSLLISCNVSYHMHNGNLVLDSKKGLKLADIKAYYDKYCDSEVLAILIDSDIWYKLENGKLTYTEAPADVSAPAPAPADDREAACKIKADKLTDEEDTVIEPVEIITMENAHRIVWITANTKKRLTEIVSYFLTLTVNNEFWLYGTETRKVMKLTDYAKVKHINSSMWRYNIR